MRTTPFFPADNRRSVWIGLGLILAAALALRLYKLTALAMWFDEAASWIVSSYPLSTLFDHVRAETAAPLYFLVLKGWCSVFGDSVAALRWLSLTFGVAGVWLIFLFVREAFQDDRLALLSALMLAVNPLQVEYARETRMYTMGVLLILLANYLLARAIRLGRQSEWLQYALVAAACLYTHYFLVFSIAAQAAVALGVSLAAPPPRRRRMLNAVALAYAAVAILFAPWLPAFLEQQRQIARDYWALPLSVTGVLNVPWAVLFGSPELWASIPLLVIVAIAALALVVLKARRAAGWPDWLVLAQALLPIACAVVLSIRRPMMINRYFLFASASWSIVAAAGAMMPARPMLRRVIAAGLVVVMLYALERNLNAVGLLALRHPPLNPPGVAGAADYINRHAAPDDAIVVTNSLIYFSFNYYNRANRALLRASTIQSIPVYSGRAMLTPEDLATDLGSLCCPRRVWYVWTDGFHDGRPDPPSDWQLVTRSRFVDAPSFKGRIFVEELLLPQPRASAAPAITGKR